MHRGSGWGRGQTSSWWAGRLPLRGPSEAPLSLHPQPVPVVEPVQGGFGLFCLPQDHMGTRSTVACEDHLASVLEGWGECSSGRVWEAPNGLWGLPVVGLRLAPGHRRAGISSATAVRSSDPVASPVSMFRVANVAGPRGASYPGLEVMAQACARARLRCHAKLRLVFDATIPWFGVAGCQLPCWVFQGGSLRPERWGSPAPSLDGVPFRAFQRWPSPFRIHTPAQGCDPDVRRSTELPSAPPWCPHDPRPGGPCEPPRLALAPQ